jgi:hypothetical protein
MGSLKVYKFRLCILFVRKLFVRVPHTSLFTYFQCTNYSYIIMFLTSPPAVNSQHHACNAKLRPSSIHSCSFYAQSRQSAKLFSSRWNWDSPNPSPAGENAPPPLVSGGGAAGLTRWREKGWESPNSDEGTYTVVLCKYMYFVILCLALIDLSLTSLEQE